ncbi:MAG: Mu-like prophage major head subunit gpT family protein [Bryobacteraceae bacterium]
METRRIPHQYLEARFAAESADKEGRTVPMVFYSGSPVLQFNWDKGLHNLTLSMEPGHIRLKRMKAGAPFTRGHSDPNDPDSVIGRVTGARLENGAALADVRFSKRAEVDPILADIFDGILENVSVEARLYKLKETTKDGDKLKSFLATDWEPTAVALVALGADPNAKIKASDEVHFSECQIEERASSPQEQPMEAIEKTGTGAQPDVTAAVAEARLAEQTRATEILNIAKLAKIDSDVVQGHITSGGSVENFRKIAFETLAKRSEENPTNGTRAVLVRDQGDTRRKGIPQAILAIQGLAELKDSDPGVAFRNLAGRGLMAIAADCLLETGQNPRDMSRDDIARLALTTSDLPYLLGATADSSLRAGYASVPSQWPRLGARRVVNNFRPQYEIHADLTAGFPQVKDSGEYQSATISEGRETYRVYTYGNKLHITRQAIINDSLGGLTDIPQQMGARAAYRQANLFWAHLVANGALVDGYALFQVANHANLITSSGTAISVDSLGVMRKTLALQTNGSGEVIGLTPKYMVVPATKEQLARQYMSNAFNPTAQSSINPWVNMAELIVEPRLDASSTTAWYLFADPAIAPVMVHVYLAGNDGVFSQAEPTVDIDGFKWLMRFDFGVGSVDYRGAVKNDGA